MTVDWDNSSSYDADTDSVKISTATAAYDAYDADPDTENYADGNSPETAYQNQGRPDSPNGLGSYTGDDNSQEDWDSHGGYPDNADQNAEADETGHDDQTTDMWGDTDPDAANYADLDSVVRSSERQDDLEQHGLAADRDADHNPPDEAATAETYIERSLSPEEQRISALEAERDQTRQELADLKAELNARLDRMERLQTPSEPNQDGGEGAAEESVADNPDVPQDPDPRELSRAERRSTDQAFDAKTEERAWWRRAATGDNLGIAGAVVGLAGQTAALVNVAPEGVGLVGLGGAVLSLGSAAKAKYEKRRKEKA